MSVPEEFIDCLTIVVPVLNEAKQLNCLVSHLNTLPCRIIVVDGGSTDGTYTALCASIHSHVRTMRVPSGRARQMNAGAAQADTPLLLFLHADTTLPSRGVELVVDALRSGESPWGRFDVRFDDSAVIFNVIAWFMNWRSALTGICTGDQAIFTTAKVFSTIHGFDEIPLMEDIELSRKLKHFGKPVRLNASVTTAARRWRLNGPIRTILRMWWLRLRYRLGAAPESLAKWYEDAR